nr:MAG TPA: hypothetical protein [Caudoviricetes sp.]
MRSPVDIIPSPFCINNFIILFLSTTEIYFSKIENKCLTFCYRKYIL